MTPGEVRRIALSLPEAIERETWEHPTFRVREKIFATLWENGQTSVLRSTLEEQTLLVEDDPLTFQRAPYFGRHGWIQVRIARAGPTLIDELLVDAWRLAAPKRLRETLVR